MAYNSAHLEGDGNFDGGTGDAQFVTGSIMKLPVFLFLARGWGTKE